MMSNGVQHVTPLSSAPPWQPDHAIVSNILQVFHAVHESTNYTAIESYKARNDFPLYCAFIVANYNPHNADAVVTVQRIAIALKNSINRHWETLLPPSQEYIRIEVVKSLAHPHLSVRRQVGTVVASIANQMTKRNVNSTIFSDLLLICDSNNPSAVDGALDALQKICEDMTLQLDNTAIGQPVNMIIPKLISFLSAQQEDIYRPALKAVNHFLFTLPQAMQQNMNAYLSALFALANSPSPAMKRLICQAFVALVEKGQVESINAQMDAIIRFMLACSQDADTSTALDATDFWTIYCKQEKTNKELIAQYLPSLVRILMKGMIYSDADAQTLEADGEENTHIADTESSQRPYIHQSRVHTYAGIVDPSDYDDDDDDDDDDDAFDSDDGDNWLDETGDTDETGTWTLRKYSAAALDTLAHEFKERLFNELMPPLQEAINAVGRTPEEDRSRWTTRESGILALGAVAEGCYEAIKPALEKLIPFLLKLLDDQRPLIRSITCWTLSRYVKWISVPDNMPIPIQPPPPIEGQAQVASTAHGWEYEHHFFQHLLYALITRINDRNKRVQESACSAFAIFAEECGTQLTPHLFHVVRSLMYAFHSYQSRNKLFLYDSLSTLAEAVGNVLGQPRFVAMIVPPIIQRWNDLMPTTDKHILPLMECLTSIATAMGAGFSPYTETVYVRCIHLIEQVMKYQREYLLMPEDEKETNDPPKKEFVVLSLDLLSGLFEGLATEIQPLVQNSNALQLIYQCVRDLEPTLRQSSFALLGDFGRCCPSLLEPSLNHFLPIAAQNLNPAYQGVCNNASWAIGEIALHVNAEEMKPHIPLLIAYLAQLLITAGVMPALHENAAVTIGRLSYVCSAEVAVHSPKFGPRWCLTLPTIRDQTEKDYAYTGLAFIIEKNPGAVIQSFFAEFCAGILLYSYIRTEVMSAPNTSTIQWQHIDTSDPQVEARLGSLLNQFRSAVGAEVWPQLMNMVEPSFRQQISAVYGV